MTRVKKLGTGIYFSAQKLIPVLLLVLCSFLKTFSVTTLDVGSSILFLTAYDGACIPQAFMATAVLIFLIWPALTALKEKHIQGPARVMTAAAVVSLLIYPFFLITSAPFPNAIAMVWKEGFRVIMETAFWVAAFRFGIFNGRLKTLCSVLAVQALAILCAAGLINLTPENHIELLILWAAFFAFIGGAVLRVLIENGSAPIVKKFAFKKQAVRRTGTDTRQKYLYFCYFILAGLLMFSVGLFDYYFLKSLNVADHSLQEIIRVFSCVLALLAVLIFLFLTLSAKGKVSLFSLLYLIPVVLLMAAAGGWFSIFGLIAAGRAILGLSLIEAKETVMQTVPLAVSLRTGFRATILRKSVIEPSSLLLCGGFLWYAEDKITPQHLIYFMFGLAVVLLIAIICMRQIYLKLILNLLKAHLWRGGRLLLTGKRINHCLSENLKSSNTEEVLYALRVMEEALSPVFVERLKQALHHPNEDVRLYALTKIDALNFTSAVGLVERLVDKDDSLKVRQTALRVLCSLGDNRIREKAEEYVNDPAVREGALAGLLAVGHEGVFVAIEQTARLAASSDATERKAAADVLGAAANPAFYHPLTALLNDENQDVCRAALIAAGKLRQSRLLPAVMETFRFPALREDAVEVLLQFGEKSFPEIEKILLNTEYPVQFRILLTRIVGRITVPAAEKFLFKHIRIEDRRVRFNIIKSLVIRGYKATGKNINSVRLCLYDEIETATGILAAINTFDKKGSPDHTEHLNILKSALNGEIAYIKERILLLLALLQPSAAIKDLLLNHYAAADNDNDKTIKIVDKILSGEMRTLCLPLFENKTVYQKLALLRPHFYPPILPVEGHILDILETADGEFTDWTRACAAYVAGNIKNVLFINSLTTLLTNKDPIIRETAVWAIGKILPREEASRLLIGNLSDPTVSVARMARFIIDGTGQTVF